MEKMPMPQKTIPPIGAFLLLSALVVVSLSGCIGGKNPANFRRSDPSEYYLYIPEGYSPEKKWPVFIGIHGFGGSGIDCWNAWQQYADTEGFILVCPSFADSGGGWYQDDAENKLNNILNSVYEEYSIQPQYFLAGFSAGAQFVQGYAYNYAKWVKAVSVISAGNFYAPGNSKAKNVYFRVSVGDLDTERIDLAKDYAQMLKSRNFRVSYYVLEGVGHTLSVQAKELTIDLFHNLYSGQ